MIPDGAELSTFRLREHGREPQVAVHIVKTGEGEGLGHSFFYRGSTSITLKDNKVIVRISIL